MAGETEYRLYEDPDGQSGFAQVATVSRDSEFFDLEVFLPARASANYRLDACSSVGCSGSATISVTGSLVAAIGYFKGSNTESFDNFGEQSIAFSQDGMTLAVSAIGEDGGFGGVNGVQTDNSQDRSGAAFVFQRDEFGTWFQQAYLKASIPEAIDNFGYSVSLSADGDLLAIGAPGDDSSSTGVNGDQADNSVVNSGAVYLFRRDAAGSWRQDTYIKASNTDAGDAFGSRVALSGDGSTLAAGALTEQSNASGVNGDQTDNSLRFAGAVYVFANEIVGGWRQRAYVKAGNPADSDQFGASLDFSQDGSTLAVGAEGESSGSTGINGVDSNLSESSRSGAAYVFVRDQAGIWTQQAFIKASNAGQSDAFGNDVALSASGATLTVGARVEDSSAVGVGGDQANDDADNSGAVYVFDRDAAAVWGQTAYIKSTNTDGDTEFGYRVAMSDDGALLAVSALFEDGAAVGLNGDQSSNGATFSGAAYTYTKDAFGNWSPQSYIKASNAESRDYFGGSLSLAGDGSVLAVGAEHEDSNAIVIGGDQTDNSGDGNGAVYIY